MQRLQAAAAAGVPSFRVRAFVRQVERYQGREKLLLRLVQSKYHPGSGSYDPTLPTPRTTSGGRYQSVPALRVARSPQRRCRSSLRRLRRGDLTNL